MKARLEQEFEHCFYCPFCSKRLADNADGAFDFPDMTLKCLRANKRVIVERVRYFEMRSVEVPEWCPIGVEE